MRVQLIRCSFPIDHMVLSPWQSHGTKTTRLSQQSVCACVCVCLCPRLVRAFKITRTIKCFFSLQYQLAIRSWFMVTFWRAHWWSRFQGAQGFPGRNTQPVLTSSSPSTEASSRHLIEVWRQTVGFMSSLQLQVTRSGHVPWCIFRKREIKVWVNGHNQTPKRNPVVSVPELDQKPVSGAEGSQKVFSSFTKWNYESIIRIRS